MVNFTPEILFAPLIGFVALGLFGKRMPRQAIGLAACGLVLLSFLFAVADFVSMLGAPLGQRAGDVILWQWVAAGSLRIDFGLLSDQLSAIMLLIVTGVGFLIHVYSIGYMEDDASFWRFFSFLNLFEFAMILLVSADSFLFLLVGWAGVGLASFLLIGFWYTKPSAVAAAKKAFIINVIGDFGLMLAIFLIFLHYGALAYVNVLHVNEHIMPAGALTAITLLLFLAAATKSAQLPLHTWLPDAMEGPTPVSALIHAATMVTAGVYLVARAAPLFTAAPWSLLVVGVIGGVTALFAATIACVQTDIKRVLAYSTMSQLGYMFMGEAAGGFATGIFHLTTHAYFKALLFMSAGAVIHALGGEQDMRRMGGLRARMPLTFWCFLAGGLALAAIVPFAGFWSKDAILGALLAKAATAGNGGWYLLYVLGLITAGLTGFYVFRLIFSVFLGEYRGATIAAGHGEPTSGKKGRAQDSHPLAGLHHVGGSMTVPMAALAVLALFGGFYGTPWADAIGGFLQPVLGAPVGLATDNPLLYMSLLLGLLVALGGIVVAWMRYGQRQPSFTPSKNWFVQLLEHKYYVDEFYDAAIVRPIVALAALGERDIERTGLDGGSRGLAWVVARGSASLRWLQTGYTRNYALAIFTGAALILAYYLVRASAG